jgi:predicted DNA binding protein
MTYYELVFKLQHDCPYNNFSKQYPSAVVSHWCNWSRDVLEIAAHDSRDGEVKRGIQEMLKQIGSKIIQNPRSTSSTRVVIQHCACDRLPPPTLPTIEKRNCLNLQPMVYTAGWEWYRIAAFSNRDIRTLFRDFDKDCVVEVTSRRSIPEETVHNSLLISTRSLLGGLTSKQTNALLTALDHGYYNLPRSASAEEIARRLGIPRTSFVDHLRKAQNKVMQAMGSYLHLQLAEPDRTGP